MSRKTNTHNRGPNGQASDSVSRRNVLRSGAAGAAIVSGMTLAGCIGNGDGEGNGGDQVAIISSPAGFDDNAFNDNALSGLEEAADEFDFEIREVNETNESEYESQQANLAETGDYDLIVMVGEQHLDPLETNAEEYSDQYWMLINNHPGNDNVSGWIEMNNEMSFLAGIAAGTLTHEDISNGDSSTDPDESIVGFVGGQDIDLINAFEASYIQGVEFVDEDIEVLTAYGDGFSDTGPINDNASSQFDEGADIVWHAAAAAGAGAFQAAVDSGRFALGVDSDQSQNADNPEVILGSAIKKLNEASYQVAEAVYNDNWDDVSGEQNLDIETEGIDFVVGKEFEGEMPDSLEENLSEAKDAVINDEIEFECGPTGCN